jgi:hypothetical protein
MHEYTALIQFLCGIVRTAPHTADTIGKVNRSISLNDQIVCAAEPFTLVAIGQDCALAVFLDSIDGPARPGCNHEPALPVERKPVRSD